MQRFLSRRCILLSLSHFSYAVFLHCSLCSRSLTASLSLALSFCPSHLVRRSYMRICCLFSVFVSSWGICMLWNRTGGAPMNRVWAFWTDGCQMEAFNHLLSAENRGGLDIGDANLLGIQTLPILRILLYLRDTFKIWCFCILQIFCVLYISLGTFVSWALRFTYWYSKTSVFKNVVTELIYLESALNICALLCLTRLVQQMLITGQRASAILSEQFSYSISCLLLPIMALPCSTTWECMRKSPWKEGKGGGNIAKDQGAACFVSSPFVRLFRSKWKWLAHLAGGKWEQTFWTSAKWAAIEVNAIIHKLVC